MESDYHYVTCILVIFSKEQLIEFHLINFVINLGVEWKLFTHGSPKCCDSEINHSTFWKWMTDERTNKSMSHWHQNIITIDTFRICSPGIVCLSEAQAAGVLLINLALAAFGFCSAQSAQRCFRTVKLGLRNRGMLAPDSVKITAS